MTVHEMLHALQGLLDLLVGGGIRTAHKALTAGAEGSTRDNRHTLLFEQFLGKCLIVHAGDGDVGESIEGAMRLEGGQTKLVQAANDQLAAAIVLITHLDDELVTVLDGLQGCQLRHGGGRHDGVLVDRTSPLMISAGPQAKPARQPVMA